MTGDLVRRISGGEITVCVIGQGYVGLSVAARAAATGLTTYGVDQEADRVEQLAAGATSSPGSPTRVLRAGHESGPAPRHDRPSVHRRGRRGAHLRARPRWSSTVRTSAARRGAARSVAQHLTPGSLVVLESTTYPGTTEQVVAPDPGVGPG